MGVNLSEIEGSLSQCNALIRGTVRAAVRAAGQMAIERRHELRGAVVLHVPESQESGLRAGVDQPPNQSKQLVTFRHYAQAGRAPTEGDEFGRESKLIEIVKTQYAIAQTDSRKHRVILPEVAMRGDVNEPAVGPFLLQHSDRGTLAKEQLGPWNGIRNRMGFVQNKGRGRVRNAEYESGCGLVRGPGPAKAKNRSTGRVRNSE